MFRDIAAWLRTVTTFCTTTLRFFSFWNLLPLVFWHCWFDVRKSMQPVKNCVMRCWCGYLSGDMCQWLRPL